VKKLYCGEKIKFRIVEAQRVQNLSLQVVSSLSCRRM